MCLESETADISFQHQVTVPVTDEERPTPLGFRANTLAADALIPEIKALAALIPAHDAQLPTHPRMSRTRVGLLPNVHAIRLTDGPQRFIM